jgi:hypothetical protein
MSDANTANKLEAKQAKEELAVLEGKLPEAPKQTKISIDNTPTEVLDYEVKGFTLFFDDEPGRLLNLSDEVVEKLSSTNRTRYLVACGVHARLKEEREHPEVKRTPGLEISPRLASATNRLLVRNKKPGMAYCWKRSDELRQASYEGWKVAIDPNLETFGGEVGSTRQVSAGGQTELVLMEIPEETSLAMQRAAAEKSEKRAKNVEASTQEDIRRSGGIPYVQKPGDKVNFS